MEKKERGAGSGGDFIRRLPEVLLLDILARLDVESLCSAAPACRALRSSASRALASIPALDLSGFSPSTQILNRVLGDNKILRSLTLDCSKLDDSSVEIFARENLQELVLLKCSLFTSFFSTAIGERCPNLRLLTLEMVCRGELESPRTFKKALAQMLKGCLYLESLCIKFQRQYPGQVDYESVQLVLPKTIRSLLLQPISDWQAKLLILDIGVDRNSDASSADVGISSLRPMDFRLRSLSLVLNRITDELLISIADNLHHLAELCLEDKPLEEPSLHYDLTNSGLQSLASSRNLTRLSLTRSKQFCPATFRRVNDVGILLLTEGCEGLESVRLGGFSKVTDAGYVSILHSCKKLKRFEVVNAAFLSDLAFHDLADAPISLVEVRLVSCNLLTSESVVSLSSCRGLEVLDLSGCKSIADAGLNSIAKLCKLTTLDLRGADITDSGLSALGGGSSPIASLCLRGCKRISDRGVDRLLRSSGCVISRTLSTLDLGFLPGVSDRAIAAIVEVCREITELCLRHCFFLTDASMEALSSMEEYGAGISLRRLDIYNCSGLSIDSLRLLDRPRFRGLRWLGVGGTRLSAEGKDRLMEISGHRPGLRICFSGCEMGCKDGWQFHEDL